MSRDATNRVNDQKERSTMVALPGQAATGSVVAKDKGYLVVLAVCNVRGQFQDSQGLHQV